MRPPSTAEAKRLTKGQTLISFFYPGQNEKLMELANAQGANVIAMDMVPRISRAQKMDALSSMANIAGYRAVIEAGNNFGRFFTGQVTAAGKVPPAKVLVVGAGVAGLAAIGTSTSLGAITYAFDVRPEVAEQIESMGAEFVYLDFDEEAQDGAATGGYAAPSSPEFREKQLEKFRELAPEMDIVITTALIPGRDAPKLWTKDMVEAMKPGSVIVDLAAERGGNCELTVPDEKIVTKNGVTIVGYTDFPSRMAAQAIDALFQQRPPHADRPDAQEGRQGRSQHGRRRDPGRNRDLQEQDHLPAAAAQGAGDRGAEAEKDQSYRRPEEKKAQELALFKQQTRSQVTMLAAGAVIVMLVGAYAPASFMQHFIVFVLAVFVGFQVIWNVSHSLHTPLMAITNAISSIIILGALMQIGSGSFLVILLAALSIFMAGINIFGGFLVTRRMLAMFQKS